MLVKLTPSVRFWDNTMKALVIKGMTMGAEGIKLVHLWTFSNKPAKKFQNNVAAQIIRCLYYYRKMCFYA